MLLQVALQAATHRPENLELLFLGGRVFPHVIIKDIELAEEEGPVGDFLHFRGQVAEHFVQRFGHAEKH